MPPCIQVTNLTKRYGSKEAVSGLTLEVNQGEVFGLLGPNGAGKTTTLYMLTGLIRPTSGTISIFGRPLRRNFIDTIGRIGALVERPSFYEHLTVRRNLLLLASLSGRDVTVDRALDLVGLRDVGRQKVRSLSKGMRQRLGLAAAFLTEPELLILDEPTTGLDAEMAHEILNLLRRLADDGGVTVLVSSHQLHEAELLCDRVAVLNEGKLVARAETDELLAYDETQVEVIVEGPEAAARRLREADFVVSAQVKGGRLHVELKEGNVHHLTSFLIGAGYRVSGVIPRRRSLHEYFLKAINT